MFTLMAQLELLSVLSIDLYSYLRFVPFRYNFPFLKEIVMRLVVVAAALSVLAGCASITSESTQLVRVDALDEEGDAVKGATCVPNNDKGENSLEAGRHARVN